MHSLANRRIGEEIAVRAGIGFALAIALGTGPASADDSWRVVVRAQCEAMAPGACLGAYGFEMKADGVFSAGPSPAGRSVGGRMDAKDHKALASAVARVLADPEAGEVACGPIRGVPGAGETVAISANGRDLVLRGGGGALDHRCVRGPVDTMDFIFRAAHRAMARGYPRPFE